MGTFSVSVEVAGPGRDQYEKLDVLVDTGSTYTVLPRRLLHQLGVQVDRRARFLLADGSEVEMDMGRAWIRFEGGEQCTSVVFGDDRLLGAVTLEEFLLAPDPVAGRLVPVPALLKRAA